MSSHLQRRFARGVHYNMKVLIRGDTNVGKTSLFRRLQGLPFSEQHCPTPEIQVASIQWSYKVTDDVVKVEVWDVVDRAQKRRTDCLLKLDNSIASSGAVDAALDAEFLNVYQGSHCVLLLLDVTKPWTLEYVRRQLPLIPASLPVLVLGNRCDRSEERVVQAEQVRWLVDSVRTDCSEEDGEVAPVAYTDCSMRSGFGMRWLHHFFSIPFLMLQRRSLQRQLELSGRHMTAALQELQLLHDSPNTDFQLFLKTRANSVTAPDSDSKIVSSVHPTVANTAPQTAVVKCQDDYCPDVTLDDNFLQDLNSPIKNGVVEGGHVAEEEEDGDEDEDETAANPLVACIEEEAGPIQQSVLSVSAQRHSSDSEDDGQLESRSITATKSRTDARLVISDTPIPEQPAVVSEEAQPPLSEQADVYLSLDDTSTTDKRRQRSKKQSHNPDKKKKGKPDGQRSQTQSIEQNSLEDFLNSS